MCCADSQNQACKQPDIYLSQPWSYCLSWRQQGSVRSAKKCLYNSATVYCQPEVGTTYLVLKGGSMPMNFGRVDVKWILLCYSPLHEERGEGPPYSHINWVSFFAHCFCDCWLDSGQDKIFRIDSTTNNGWRSANKFRKSRIRKSN